MYANKNVNRRKCRAADPEGYGTARELRRLTTRNGAFGKIRSAAKFNALVAGTMGLPRVLEAGE